MPAAALRLVLLLVSLVLAVPALAAPVPIPVRGLVVEGADERPVAGARVALLAVQSRFEAAGGWLAGTSPVPVAQAATDDKGRFELQAPQTGIWRVTVEAPGRMPMELVVEPLLEALELPAAQLVPDAGLEVRVRDAAGRPAAARLAVFQPALGDVGPVLPGRGGAGLGWQTPVRRAVAGADGLARLPRASGERLRLVAAAPDGPAVRLQVGSGRRLEVTLPAGVPLAVRVLDEAGRPAAGSVALDDSGLLALGQADAQGGWTASLPAGELTLLWHGSGGRSGSQRLAGSPQGAAAPPATPAIVRLELPAAVTGRVVDRPGRRAVVGALVWFQGFPESLVRTGADGRYAVRPPAPCRAPLRSAAPGYLPPSGSFGAGGCAPPGPVFALEPAAGIEGVVVDGAGRPLAGARLTAAAADRERMSPLQQLARPSASARTRSSTDGRFRLAALLPGQAYHLDVQLAGFAPAELEVAPLAAAEVRPGLRVVLGAGRTGSGRVVDAAGRPVAGARLRLVRAQERRRPGRSADWRAVAAADGRFEVAGLLPGHYDLRAAAPGFAVSEVPGIDVPSPTEGKAGAAVLGTVVLRPGVAVTGRVVDRAGAPVAGAEVEAAGRRRLALASSGDEDGVATDADGRFTLGDLAAGESVVVRVSKPGYAQRSVENAVAPTSLRVVLAPAGRLAGRVLDPDRRAVEGAQIFASGGGDPFPGFTVSHASGSFALEGLAGGTLELAVSAEGFVPYRLAGVEVPEGGERTGLELVLEPGATIEGRVLGADGQPAAGALLRIRDREAGLSQADGEGTFRLAGVPLGPLVLVAEHPAYPAASRDLDVRPGVNSVTLTFEAGGEVAGRVVDGDGLPLAGARVTLFPDERTGARPDVRTATSVADGTFAFAGLRPGSYFASAEREGYVQDRAAARDLQVATGRRSEVEIRLDPATAVLRGRLLGLAPADLGGVRVYATGHGLRTGRVDPQGGYVIEGVAPGDWRVEAKVHFTGRQAQGQVTIPEGANEATLDLDFAGGLTLSGVVTRDGEPVPGVAFLMALGEKKGFHSAEIRADGSFAFTGLPPGRYQLQMREPPGRSTVHSEEVEVDADRTLRIELVTARVSGRVLDGADGSPVAGAAGRLEPVKPAEGPSLDRPAATESDTLGVFHLQSPEGTFRLVANRDGYAPAETVVELQGASPLADVELRLQATEGISFEVLLASGQAPQAVRLAVVGADGRPVLSGELATTQGGRVRASTVPAGTWELLVQAGQSATVSLPITAPGAVGRVVLPPAARLVATVPSLTGEGAAGAILQLAEAATGRAVRLLDWNRQPVASWPLAGGEAVVFGLAPGAYGLTVTAADGRTWTGSATVAPGGNASVTLP